MIAITEAEQNAVLRMENEQLRQACKHKDAELVRARARVVDPALYALLGAVEEVIADYERGADPFLAKLGRCWKAWHGPSP